MSSTAADPGPQPDHYDSAWVRAKYEFERQKRLRNDGLDQFVEVTAEFSHYEDDPYTAWVDREPIEDEVGVLVVGAGLGSILAAVRLQQAGVTDIRIVDKAGDFGGTWYWNRYPGAQCDVESYIYIPLLEELDYVPKEKYSYGPEIRDHLQRAARHFELYDNALLQTAVTGATWDEQIGRWLVSTDRGDRIRAQSLVVSPGSLVKPKLPGIPGINEFKGHTFHTSRWDYGYTGGDEQGSLTGLADKRVGVVGTGATGLQVVPKLGRWAQQLYVFQRTPNAVDVRNNRPTDAEWAASLEPGWQWERTVNFTRVLDGAELELNLVNDGWTEVAQDLTAPAVIREMMRRGGEMTMDEIGDFLYEQDYKSMEGIRDRIDSIVKDKRTAEALKPWYKRQCKRIGFHDEYLDTFNRDNVELVDTDGKGITRFTEDGVVVGDVEFKLDALVFATGFEVGTNYTRRTGFDIVGRDGVPLSNKWAKGPRTLHGFQTNGFPNCFFLGYTQTGVTHNYTHGADERARHLAHILGHLSRTGARTVEVEAAAEEDWTAEMRASNELALQWFDDCTPSYLSSEGTPDDPDSLLLAAYGGGPVAFFDILEKWRAAGDFEGLSFT